MPLLPHRTAAPAARPLNAVGLDPHLPPIRRAADGGIDYDWYLVRARAARANSIGAALGRVADVIRKAFAGWSFALRERRRRKRALAELLAMDDRGLHDLGLNRTGVYFAVDHGREPLPPPANLNRTRRDSAA